MTQTVLIAGASGLVGTAAVDSFLNAGWEVIAVSRRRPEVSSTRAFRHLPVDLQNADECVKAFGALPEVSHLVYAAVFEKPGLIQGWQDMDQMQTNLKMIRNVVEPLGKGSRLKHVSLLQGTKAYGVHLHPIRIPARERYARDDHPNSYWFQEDYIKEKSAEMGFGWNIFRPTIVLGPNVGVAMNTVPVIGVYAALCRELRQDFSYTGHISFPREAVDTRLIGDACVWAANNQPAWNEHFNLTNGEVFSWKDLWPSLADFLQVKPGADQPRKLAEFLPAQAAVWQNIVSHQNLRPLTMAQILGESHFSADSRFGYGLKTVPAPAFVSTVKIKNAGFHQVYDTEACVKHWLNVLVERNILPDPTKHAPVN